MTEFVTCVCAQCNVVFGLTPETDRVLRQSSAGFKCPFGHPLVFSKGESEADKLRRERDRLKQENARLDEERHGAWATANAQLERARTAERQAAAARGQVTKLKKRAANGVCPCCNRTFANLQRHMATKHAGFVAEEVTPEGATIQ